MFCYRVHPSNDWIQSQIPEIIRNGVKGLSDEVGDDDEMDAEAFVQAYVHIVAGACISLGNVLYDSYFFLLEVKFTNCLPLIADLVLLYL